MFGVWPEPGESVILPLIGIEDFDIFARRGLEAIIGKGSGRVKIQREDKVFALEYQDFLFLISS